MVSKVILFLNLGTPEIMLIAFVALLLFGGKKLPELARGLGKGLRDFKEASDGLKTEINNQINTIEEPIAAAAKDEIVKPEASAKVETSPEAPVPDVQPEYNENSYDETYYGETNHESGGFDESEYNYSEPASVAHAEPEINPVQPEATAPGTKLKSKKS